MTQDLANNLKARRKALGLSQAEVARRSGTQQRQVSLFERGGDITLATLNKLAQALDIELRPVPREHIAKITALIANRHAPESASLGATANESLLERYQIHDDEAAANG